MLVSSAYAGSMEYFVGTEQQCINYIAKLDAMMGYPDGKGTTTYANPIPHDAKPGVFMVPIKSVWAPALGHQAMISDIDNAGSVSEKVRTSRSKLKTEGAFKLE